MFLELKQSKNDSFFLISEIKHNLSKNLDVMGKFGFGVPTQRNKNHLDYEPSFLEFAKKN